MRTKEEITTSLRNFLGLRSYPIAVRMLRMDEEIPQDATQEYVDYIAKFVGAENVYPMQIRAAGAIHLEA